MMTLPWQFPSSPVILPGQLNPPHDSARVAMGHVLKLGDRYRMYYWGSSAEGANKICIAESPVASPNQWRGLGAVLGPQPETDYNIGGPVIPMVLPRDDEPWLMYPGTVSKPGFGGFYWSTGVALSDDRGLTWRWHTTSPLVSSGRDYDCGGTGTVFVLREGKDLYRMWYTSGKGLIHNGVNEEMWVGIGYAVSRDGIHWECPFDDWMIPPRAGAVEPFEPWIAKPFVVVDTDSAGRKHYRMWVSAKRGRYRIQTLISEDGLKWSWEPDPPDEPGRRIGLPGAFDDQQRSYASVIREGNEHRMWYTGNLWGGVGCGYATLPIDMQAI